MYSGGKESQLEKYRKGRCIRPTQNSPSLSFILLPGVREELDAHLEEERGQAAGNPDARVAQPPLPARVVRGVVLAARVLEPRVVEEFLPHKSKHANRKRTSIQQKKKKPTHH